MIKMALSVTITGDPTTVRAEMVLLEMDRHALVKSIKLFSAQVDLKVRRALGQRRF